MYGLAGRESLSKRQNAPSRGSSRTKSTSSSRSVPQIIPSMVSSVEQVPLYTSKRSLPERHAAKAKDDISDDDDEFIVPKRPVKKHNATREDLPASADITRINRILLELSEKYEKLEKDYQMLKQQYNKVDLQQKTIDLHQKTIDLHQQAIDLQQKNTRDSTSGESATMPLPSLVVEVPEARPPKKASPEASSLFSPLTDIGGKGKLVSKQAVREFIPYIVKEEYTGINSKTLLSNDSLKMSVETNGIYIDTPSIYPFGYDRTLPQFAEMNIQMSFKDASMQDDGTAYGLFKRRNDGVYTIELTKLFDDEGDEMDIKTYSPPINIKCNIDLVRE